MAEGHAQNPQPERSLTKNWSPSGIELDAGVTFAFGYQDAEGWKGIGPSRTRDLEADGPLADVRYGVKHINVLVEAPRA